MPLRQAADTVQQVGDLARLWAGQAPDHPAVCDESGIWTYAELARIIVSARNWLVAMDVRPGDRVLLVGENACPLVALFMAACDLAAIPVLANARLSRPELEQIRQHSGARRAIFVAAGSAPAVTHARHWGARLEDAAELGTLGVSALDPGTVPEPVESDPRRRTAAMIYTSGTTGTPKGVMLTHDNLLFMAAASGRVRQLAPRDRFYAVLPVTHVVGLSVVTLGTLMHGATLVLAPRFSPAAALAALARGDASILLGAPAMFAMLADAVQTRGLNAASWPALRLMGACGAPLDMATKTRVEAVFGLTLHNGYGITECSPTIAQTRPGQPRADLSVGPPLPGVETRLVGPDGAAVMPGEVGELQVRGPSVMKGYYRNPADTLAAIDEEGWFRTRDLARCQDGGLFIVGRTKELIIRFGFNVYPAEVEAVLSGHPAVARCAVIGHAAGGREEEVIAFAEPAGRARLTAEDLMRHAAMRLAAYKRPSRIFVLDALPTGPTGKVLKPELSRMAAEFFAAGR